MDTGLSYEDLGPDIHKFVVHVLLVKERVPVAVEPVEPSPDNQELIEASDEDRDVELDQEDCKYIFHQVSTVFAY